MSERLIDLLLRLTPRERTLLALLFALVLPLALGLGALWPLAEQRRAAEGELAEARVLDSWVLDREAELGSLARLEPAAPVGPAIGASAVEQSLIETSLRPSLSSLETRDGGEIALEFELVSFTSLMRWLDAEDPAWGYDISVLRIRQTDRPAMVAAQLNLVPANDP